MKQELARVVGIPGAVLLGLGSILGTGVFVSIGIAAGVAGQWVLLAVPLAALVATFNGLSSAQLAASHPVSGGTYEYGYAYLSPGLGFTAGFMFMLAKSASAATAALGLAGYLLAAFGSNELFYRTPLALALVALLTAVVAGGMRRSNRVNAWIVALTLVGLALFVGAAFLRGAAGGLALPTDLESRSLLSATALMFVAYTGYGRVATLGEEIRDPARSIPIAIVATLAITALLYVTVTAAAVGLVGAEDLAAATRNAAAPLASLLEGSLIARAVGLAAITAMAGVLLNLLLGLSRVLLAMARRRDVPAFLDRVDRRGSPFAAVFVTGGVIAALTLAGDIELTWNFSAFTVLVYYALTNLAALRLPAQARRFPRAIAVAGLISCVGLAFTVEARFWIAGLALIALGLLWHRIARVAYR